MKKYYRKEHILEKISRYCTEFTGSTPAFIIAVLIVLAWICSGPFFGFSNTWQLIINTGTTITTFLMVFLIQRAQNKDSKAVHLKLSELIASIHGPSNRLVDVEELTEEELNILAQFYRRLSERAKKERDISASHSIEEADLKHLLKYRKNKPT
jgi:low affinity Fe/Cu permease